MRLVHEADSSHLGNPPDSSPSAVKEFRYQAQSFGWIKEPCAYLEYKEILQFHPPGPDVFPNRTQVLMDILHHDLRHLSG